MSQSDEQFKGIIENSELKLLKNLINLLSEPPQQHGVKTSDELERYISRISASNHNHNNTVDGPPPTRPRNLKYYDENDDEDIVVVDSENDLEKAESQSENENDDHDDDDDVEYGQNRVLSSLANTVAATLINSNAREKSTSETETEENTIEISMLEKFKEHYVREYNLSKHKYGKYFEMILNLILKKRLCSRNWLTTCNSNRNLYFILYCLRILLRDFNFQKQFFSVENSFYSLSKLFNKYVNRYSSLHNQILLHSHILDQLLGVLTKVIMSDALIEMNRNISDGRVGSGNQTNCSSVGKKIIDTIFELKMHATLMQLIEISDELCLVHASLNILIHLASIDVSNRPKLANDLDIIDELLRILQEYDEDSKKLASKLLCFLCSEEKIKREVTNLDGVQILLSLLHNHNNLDILWNVIWSLVQICSYEDNKREIRLLGGIPVILSILCDKNLDSQLLDVQTNESNHSQNGSTAKRSHEKTDYHHKSQKMRLQILSACCALVSELAFNETNSYHIVNSNGVYLIASKLLILQKEPHIERNKDIERVHCNVWRALRLLFSFERHRSLIKKLIPFTIFTTFVDIGNFKTELKLYQPLVDQFYKLTNDEIESMKTQLKICNQTQTPKNYVNEYAVYEIIGSGGFGRVHKVKKKNSNYFLAMKEVNTHHLTTFKDISLGEIVNEVSIIRNNLKHPNIVKYLKTFKENDSLYIVMELIDGTPLSQHFVTLKEKNEQWSEDKIWNLFIQIVLALKYLHKEKNIVHRDLTSNNIMLSENDKITITDFGLAKLKQTDCSKMLSVVGTMFYSCPEIIKNEPYNEKADIWALGCILYEMCCLDPPFCTPNMLALATKITQGDYDHERLYRNSYSELVGSVVRNCLIIDPNRRPDIVGVAALIAEKILTYTDSIRYKSINLEKKLEKEKNKTQRFFCNKQDLNTYNVNYTNSTSSMKEADDVTGSQFMTQNFFMSNSTANSSSTNISANVSPATSKNSNLPAAPRPVANGDQQKRLKANERSISLSFNKENDSMNALGSALTPDSNKVINYASSPVSPSPNAKLPPNPKTKLIMKNYQNKQRQQELAAAQLQHLSQPPSHAVDLTSPAEQPSNVKMNASVTSLNQEIQGKESSTNQSTGSNATNKIQRSSSSSVLDKRPSQSKKSRPNSANVSSLPVYKKLRPIEDPIIQILEQIHKLLFITHLPPSGKKNFKRKLVDRYKRSLFSNKRSPSQIKSELMKLIKNSTDLIDMEMIGLKSVQYLGFSGCNSMSSNNNISNSQRITNAAAAAASSGSTTNLNKLQSQISVANDSCLVDHETIINQNGITYEQFQSIIEELLVENNYHMEHLRHLKAELPSMN